LPEASEETSGVCVEADSPGVTGEAPAGGLEVLSPPDVSPAGVSPAVGEGWEGLLPVGTSGSDTLTSGASVEEPGNDTPISGGLEEDALEEDELEEDELEMDMPISEV
jgi:hypothetical protein